MLVASILTVSARYVDAWLAALMEELPQYLTEEDEVVLLHFGVDDKCRVDLKLEARCMLARTSTCIRSLPHSPHAVC